MHVLRVGFDASADVRLAASRAPGWFDGSPVAERMTPASALVAVPPDTPWGDAEQHAVAHGTRHLLITDDEHLLGVVCRCDFYPAPADDEQVGARMSEDVYTLAPNATISEAAAAMARLGIGCLPVVDGDRALGVITRGDLRRAGVPESVLGAKFCVDCGSFHGVRADSYYGIDHCLNCIDVMDELFSDKNLGEGD
ncbi:MAG: domain containing protein [Myxococcales bacterium]|nr:domain containing protein [Myxococcales bacterium]